MDISEFDAWRANYGQMSYTDQQDFYDRVYADHPIQAGYALDGGLELFNRFFAHALGELPNVYVLELGGWRGELAQEMLNRFPSLAIWCNVEICRAAVKDSVFASPKYKTWIPPDHPWRVELPPSNVLVASHFIEHISSYHFAQLMLTLPEALRYMVLVAPLPESGSADWTGYHGSHKLKWGWDRIITALSKWDIELIGDLSQKDFKVFERI